MTHVIRRQQHGAGKNEGDADAHENAGPNFWAFGVLARRQAPQVTKNRDFAGQNENSAQNPQNAEKCVAPGHRWYEADGAAVFALAWIRANLPRLFRIDA